MYAVELNQDTGVFIVKSGTDFEDFSDIRLEFGTSPTELLPDDKNYHLYSAQKKMTMHCQRVRITDRFKPDPEIEQHVEFYSADLNKKLLEVCGHTECDIEARFEKIRHEETNLANWICDVIRTEFE